MTLGKLFVVGVVAVLLAIAVNTGFSLRAYDSVHSGTVANCEEIDEVKAGLRATIQEANKFSQTSKVRKQAEKQASEQFYNDVLLKFSNRNCQTELGGKHARDIHPKGLLKHGDKAGHLHN